MLRAIYETKGKAREYCHLAAEPYVGCVHGCRYCYAHLRRCSKKDFHAESHIRPHFFDALRRDAERMEQRGEKGPVHLSFFSDPFQPGEDQRQVTETAICGLHVRGIAVSILTKGGWRAQRYFDLFGAADSFGITLTTLDYCTYWEPKAAPATERIATLIPLRGHCRRWVSLEPIIRPDWTLACLRAVAPHVDEARMGLMNHWPGAWRGDLVTLVREAKAICREHGVKLMLKAGLKAEWQKQSGGEHEIPMD